MREKTKILVVFYSMTGNTFQLAKEVAEGAEKAGAEIKLRQVQELIPKEKWNEKMKQVKDELNEIPVAGNDDLAWADGIAFGTPSRYGNMSAQLKQFIDQTGELWTKGSLEGKPATVFASASTQHGGHETTMLTTWAPLIHLGMVVMGVPYSQQELMAKDEIIGSGPYGASAVSPLITEKDLQVAKAQGKRLAEIAGKLKKSKLKILEVGK